MTRDSREEVRRGWSLPGVARAVVVSSTEADAVGHVFELGLDWPKLVLSSEAILGLEDDGWWIETGADQVGTWVDGRRLGRRERVPLMGGETLTIGGSPDENGKVVGGSVLLFDATPAWCPRHSGVWGVKKS
jgi:hypothetical protein